ISRHAVKHGDSVKDVAFSVTDLESILQYAKSKNAQIVRDSQVWRDENGVLRSATIKTFGDVVHTLIDRSDYRGDFLPGFEKPRFKNQLLGNLPETNLQYIDH
uniref:4-hydroxyphenylpyruvate dioxygenase n=1 Tax=Romanomermis culicivorax TaxID=13658 RepID=A0A915KHH5_ROMCU